MPDERAARRALACVTEAGDPRLSDLVALHGPVELWETLVASSVESAWTRRAKVLRLDQMEASEARRGMRFIVPSDAEWPVLLFDLERCAPVQELGGVPLGLWVRGAHPLGDLATRSVAVVGSRASTPYGDRVASDLAAELAASRITVVSGGAFGIDAAAHRGALAEGGPTVAFLAGGVDEPYPRANERLLDQVAEHGALVSEYPPGEHPTRRRFLARNRLIAAMTQGTVMVEAAARSGARNTVTWAGGCGRIVMAVPGPVGNATSYTPHRLIREGEASLVTCADEVREMIEPLGAVVPARPPTQRLLDGLDARQLAVYEALPSRGGRDVGELSLRSGFPVGTCLDILQGLGDRGLVERRGDGAWRLGRLGDRPLLVRERRADAGNAGG